MPYVTNPDDGLRIYHEVHGSGPPVVMLHGLGYTLDGWKRFGYTDALSDRYRVILVDVRGSGKSDTPHDPAAYTRRRMAQDVLTVLDTNQLDQAHIWGYSFGNVIAFELRVTASERIPHLSVRLRDEMDRSQLPTSGFDR